MDQRTRERLPVLPTLAAAVNTARTAAAAPLSAARTTKAGELFTVGDLTLRRSTTTRAHPAHVWALLQR